MALNIATLAEKKADLKFDFAGEVVRIEYYPHKITPSYMARLQAIGNATDSDDESIQSADARMVSELLVSWDVEAEQGVPFPPTYDNLLTAPTSLVSRVAAEIVTAVGKLATPKQPKK